MQIKKWCVYIHKNKINNKVYIGQTCQNPPSKRWKNGSGYIENPHFYSAIKQNGWENFDHIIYANNLTQTEADILEKQLIQKYNSINEKFGYNMTTGGDHPAFTEESKKKISRALKGRTLSISHRKNLSKAAQKRITPPFTQIHKDKIGEHQKKKIICLETQQVFDTVKEAAAWAGLNNYRNLSSYLTRYRGKSAGKHPETKQPLHWKYYEEGEEKNAN